MSVILWSWHRIWLSAAIHQMVTVVGWSSLLFVLSFHHIAVYISQWPVGQFSCIGHILFIVVRTQPLSCVTSLYNISCSLLHLLIIALCISKILFLISIVCSCCGFAIESWPLRWQVHNALYWFLLVCCVIVVDFDNSAPFGNHSCIMTVMYIELQDTCWDRVVECLVCCRWIDGWMAIGQARRARFNELGCDFICDNYLDNWK